MNKEQTARERYLEWKKEFPEGDAMEALMAAVIDPEDVQDIIALDKGEAPTEAKPAKKKVEKEAKKKAPEPKAPAPPKAVEPPAPIRATPIIRHVNPPANMGHIGHGAGMIFLRDKETGNVTQMIAGIANKLIRKYPSRYERR